MSKMFALCLLLLLTLGTAALAGGGYNSQVSPVNENASDPPYLGPTPSADPCPDSVCTFTCPDRARHEGEYNPNYSDHYNSGCLDTDGTPSFSSIACGDTLCGTSFSRQTTRDTDWYQLVIGADQTTPVRVCFVSSFVSLYAIYRPGANGCSNMSAVVNPTMAWPCDTNCFTLPAAPGTYWLYVSYAFFHCVGTGNYVIIVDCEPEEQQPDEWDMGDLPVCGYPTLLRNPAHRLSNIAWLGEAISADETPRTVDLDTYDDGVLFVNQPWVACEVETVQVAITGGPLYAQYASGGGELYLNAWKDGNLDGDFCDTLCDGRASEWIVRDQRVQPGTVRFNFVNPGLPDRNYAAGRFRFRLSGAPLGRLGFGLVDLQGCPTMTCGTNATDLLGEVEDYVIIDLQLAVELLGGLTAEARDGRVLLSWLTASETHNDHFNVLRDGVLAGTVDGAGTSVSTHDYSFLDAHLVNGRVYHYTLEAVNVAGAREQVAEARAMPQSDPAAVTEFALYPSYPNPFNAQTRIPFDVPERGMVTLTVYDLMGREVATLVNNDLPPGRHEALFDASALPSAVYLCRLSAQGFTATEKLLLMK